MRQSNVTRSIFDIVEELRAVCERTLQEADEAEENERATKELEAYLRSKHPEQFTGEPTRPTSEQWAVAHNRLKGGVL